MILKVIEPKGQNFVLENVFKEKWAMKDVYGLQIEVRYLL